MNIVNFKRAKAVFFPFSTPDEADAATRDAVRQYGFYHTVDLSERGEDGTVTLSHAIVRLTARSVYRLHVNGEIVMHGPARTAHGYCRVDEVDITDRLIDGVNHIAIEVMAYGTACEGYGRYSNDSTLEDALLIAEVEIDGEVISATGRDSWGVCRIASRRPNAERISHCRECIEIYDLDDQYYLWKMGVGDFLPVAITECEPVYLLHESPLPTLRAFELTELMGFGSCRIDGETRIVPHFFETNSSYYSGLSEHPTADCRRTVETAYGGACAERGDDGLTLWGTDDVYVSYDGGESRVGFLRVSVTVETAGVIDVVHSELIAPDGSIPYYHNIVTRLHVPAGLTEFTCMEPCLARYVKLSLRGTGAVTVHGVSILDYAYPDAHRATFVCSDDNVNRLYAAAKRTLILNTQDIFMDCPERERGGWLCDSLWTARAASLLLSDNAVEREHLENFLLTPADGMFHGFFPEVYPALKSDYKDMTGITTWSFWLMCEVCEFIRRTGDITFREAYRERVSSFVDGTRDFLGSHGLLEDMPWIFVDWSSSNNTENTQPISTAANALYAYMLRELGEVFGVPAWTALGDSVHAALRAAVIGDGDARDVTLIPDSFAPDKSGSGKLKGRGRYSEAATCTALWSGLFEVGEAPLLDAFVRDRMGPAPRYARDPSVGESQLFIGLCIRLDMLARRGEHAKMYEDMLAIYEPQLREGPGTLWEVTSADASSRCHGFTAHAGVHLMRDVLGLGIPELDEDGEGSRRITIAPHVCGLRWARGTHETPDGLVALEWRYDGESFSVNGSLPAGFGYDLILPPEARELDPDRVTVDIRVR